MKILKKEVVYLNEKENEAFNLIAELCLSISTQSLTYDLAETANNAYIQLIALEEWLEGNLNNICNDEEEDEEDDGDDEDDEDNWLL